MTTVAHFRSVVCKRRAPPGVRKFIDFEIGSMDFGIKTMDFGVKFMDFEAGDEGESH